MDYKDEMRKLIDIVKQQSFTAPLEQTLDDMKTMANAVKDMSDRIDLRVRKSLQPTDKSKKSKAIAKAKPFPSVNLQQPSTSNATSQTTQNSAIGNQSFTSKDIGDIRNDYLQKQYELKPKKPQSPF